MERVLFATRPVAGAQEGTLEYFLLAEPIPAMAAESYGIEVVLHRGLGEERSQCRHITPVGSRILSLLTALADGAVPPCHLHDVVMDLLA